MANRPKTKRNDHMLKMWNTYKADGTRRYTQLDIANIVRLKPGTARQQITRLMKSVTGRRCGNCMENGRFMVPMGFCRGFTLALRAEPNGECSCCASYRLETEGELIRRLGKEAENVHS